MLSTLLLDRINANSTANYESEFDGVMYKNDWNITTRITSYITANFTDALNSTMDHEGDLLYEEDGFFVKNIKLIKAIVLCVVIMIMIISTCRFVFKSFSRYLDGDRKDDGWLDGEYFQISVGWIDVWRYSPQHGRTSIRNV